MAEKHASRGERRGWRARESNGGSTETSGGCTPNSREVRLMTGCRVVLPDGSEWSGLHRSDLIICIGVGSIRKRYTSSSYVRSVKMETNESNEWKFSRDASWVSISSDLASTKGPGGMGNAWKKRKERERTLVYRKKIKWKVLYRSIRTNDHLTISFKAVLFSSWSSMSQVSKEI